jgi:hypothetical protein
VLRPSLPDEWIASPMKDRQDHEQGVAPTEVDRVGEAPQYRALNICDDDRVSFGMAGCPLDRLADFVQELVAESRRRPSYQAAASSRSSFAARRKTTCRLIGRGVLAPTLSRHSRARRRSGRPRDRPLADPNPRRLKFRPQPPSTRYTPSPIITSPLMSLSQRPSFSCSRWRLSRITPVPSTTTSSNM